MSEQFQSQILEHLKSAGYRPQKPRVVANQMKAGDGETYHAFRDALRELMHASD